MLCSRIDIGVHIGILFIVAEGCGGSAYRKNLHPIIADLCGVVAVQSDSVFIPECFVENKTVEIMVNIFLGVFLGGKFL